MNFDIKTTDKPQKNVVINQSGFGKNSKQATDVMIAQGHFSKENIDLDIVMTIYKELSKAFYKKDLECIEELKEEL